MHDLARVGHAKLTVSQVSILGREVGNWKIITLLVRKGYFTQSTQTNKDVAKSATRRKPETLHENGPLGFAK